MSVASNPNSKGLVDFLWCQRSPNPKIKNAQLACRPSLNIVYFKIDDFRKL